jgi:stage V sporulation protein SpoVS
MTSPITPTTLLTRCDSILATELSADEVLAMSVEKAKYFGMRDTAAAIWRRFAEPSTIDAVVAALLLEYEVEEERCRAETTACVEHMVSRSMLCPAT